MQYVCKLDNCSNKFHEPAYRKRYNAAYLSRILCAKRKQISLLKQGNSACAPEYFVQLMNSLLTRLAQTNSHYIGSDYFQAVLTSLASRSYSSISFSLSWFILRTLQRRLAAFSACIEIRNNGGQTLPQMMWNVLVCTEIMLVAVQDGRFGAHFTESNLYEQW